MNLIIIVLSLVSFYYILKKDFISQTSHILPKKQTYKNLTYAILIPARDESKVIEELLISIKQQTKKVNPQDVYIIVESKTDKTVSIAKKHKMNIFYRQELEKQRKGYALDEAIKEILKQKKTYDAYFIFDADNVLDSKYFEEMEKSIHAGYDVGIGYRNCKNGNDSIYAAVSSLTFSMINTLGNEHNLKHNKTITVSGTGFYISGKIIEKLKGYPFYSLTEDYEFTIYAALNDYTTTYNKKAIFYDEQPTTLKETITQRTRWVRGYFDTRKKYYSKLKAKARKKDENFVSIYSILIGVKPYIGLLVAAILFIIKELKVTLIGQSNVSSLLAILSLFLLIYLILLVITAIMLRKETNTLNLNKQRRYQTLFYNPIFLLTYIICVIQAFTKKEVSWVKIEHKEKLKIERN